MITGLELSVPPPPGEGCEAGDGVQFPIARFNQLCLPNESSIKPPKGWRLESYSVD